MTDTMRLRAEILQGILRRWDTGHQEPISLPQIWNQGSRDWNCDRRGATNRQWLLTPPPDEHDLEGRERGI